jgi:hypothetical protein
MTDILIKAGVILAVLVILFTGEQYIEGRGYDRAKAEATAALEAQKREAGEVLATETAKTRAAEESLRTFKLIQDNKDAQAQNTIAALSGRVRQLAGPAGRLRDPNAQGCGGSGSGTQSAAATPAPDRPGDGAEAGGLLSEPLTKFLFEQAASADELNNAYISCRVDAVNIRSQDFQDK